ncbi:8-oxo-dGTP pyrophosphatase MutT (NUDIX family) [Streptococcus rupicaprae]|uniref:8-oxo-dGTP pyrophosphatase MutT (NUDIX family) n=1 Tax=Streptococcus rupicaprae TaxID=759619 RepID=A0ABV2FKL4_9STRE
MTEERVERLNFGVKGLMFNDEGKFLALHRWDAPQSPKLELPGGRIDFGETIEETLIREIREETNLEATPIELVTTWNYVKRDQTFQVVGIIYLASVTDLSTFKLSEEHDSYAWLELSELDRLARHFREPLEKQKEIISELVKQKRYGVV